MKKYLVTLCLMLAACTHQPPEAKPVSYDGPTYRISATRVDVVDDFRPEPSSRTEYRAKPTLAEAMHTWVNRRITAAGTQNIMEVHITEASIKRKNLPKQKSGIEGYFTKEQTEEYEGTLSVEFRLYSPERTLPVAHAEITAQRSRTLAEGASLEDRKTVYRALTADLLADIDAAADRNIRDYFTKYLM